MATAWLPRGYRVATAWPWLRGTAGVQRGGHEAKGASNESGADGAAARLASGALDFWEWNINHGKIWYRYNLDTDSTCPPGQRPRKTWPFNFDD